MVGVPPCQRHPQVASFTQTSTPKYDLFSEPLLLIVTFQEMSIKHLMYIYIYIWKVPFLNTERAYVVFSGFEIRSSVLRVVFTKQGGEASRLGSTR